MAYLCVMQLEFQLPEGADLKGKRKQLQSLKQGIAQRFGAALAETGYQDTWQRSQMAIALVSGDASELERRAYRLREWTDSRLADMTRWEQRVLTTADVFAH